ncbi:secreted protein [Candidatus Omnitrophus magneticus]|uniref:Secreted protein n=1 Tax=Candidatus Omnitrophus magneticus TaxID=1609969 RepID=A0A0F0CVI9_9BACT|nr:secreted protein [Candidatus Omnitrophus magneticus]
MSHNKNNSDYFLWIGISVFSFLILIGILSVFSSDRLYSISLICVEKNSKSDLSGKFADAAIFLEKDRIEYYQKKYDILLNNLKGIYSEKNNTEKKTAKIKICKEMLAETKKIIDICPSWPEGHMNYGLTLSYMAPELPNIITREQILSELEKAAILKPYSDLYKQIYEKYKLKFSAR